MTRTGARLERARQPPGLCSRAAAREQSRALEPAADGLVRRAGREVFYELYGEGEQTIFLLPTWSLVHSRHWKMQIPYLARHFRVLVMDGLGNGRAERCRDPARYGAREFALDCLAVMDATATERAVLVGLSRGAEYLLWISELAPGRVAGAGFIGPMFPVTPSRWGLLYGPLANWLFSHRLPLYRSWARLNEFHFRESYPDFVSWFISRCLPEAHSSKAIEDAVGWGLQTDPETLIATVLGEDKGSATALRKRASALPAPTLVLSGADDRIAPPRDARRLAELAGGRFELLPDAGHLPHVRRPVPVNLALRELAERAFQRPQTRRDPTVFRPDGRPRALFVSSPIGLGHARRDIAIARELRALNPDLQIDWLAQHPVTRMLEGEGERVHPASAHLASESAHIESESAEHDLHCFQALRRMDEILMANFMLFHDLVREQRYDLWIGDEAWELDHYLHENPSEKRAPFAWLTDFVGFLPVDERDAAELALTSDYNAEMVDHVAGQPQLRDVALFVGDEQDIVPRRLGPGLPAIRDWTAAHFDFVGYVTGFDPTGPGRREQLREQLGYRPEEQVCIVTVGGSGVGASLLARVIEAYPLARLAAPALRMIVVAGPRIDPAGLAVAEGLEVRAYVHDLYLHLAACDVAVVQGGLTTAMELTANRRPFLYFPLRHHFEQNFHVRHRLERHGAGRCMDYEDSPPEAIAAAIVEELGREVDYRPVEAGGAARAAARLSELL